MVLEKIRGCNDIKRIPMEEMPILADEIRGFLIDTLSDTGGHLASNLGTVELTMALHLCLDLPKDKIIWDVGHQSYTHKILTGRKDQFDTLRKKDGLSGFPKRAESPCDVFDTGHSSTSISAGLGMVRARELLQEHYQVVSVIGDGSLTGGMAYEALNNASSLKSNFIIILNDNAMSISRNVGGMSRYLSGIRTFPGYTSLKENVSHTLKGIPGIGNGLAEGISRAKQGIKQLVIPGMLFENIGITYLGPVDGHDIGALMQVINDAKQLNRPVLIHVLTKKGRGYDLAEKHPEKFHGVSPFDVATGKPKKFSRKTFTDIFAEELCRLGEKDERIVAVTAAMSDGTGLSRFGSLFPNRFFDVGIAEEHAVTFAAGMAASGFHPVVAVYSSFLQRAYDQILHDVCMQNLPVIFAVDRAGFVGADGETHQGVFDLSYLRMIPNMTVLAPSDGAELREALRFAASLEGPCAIRYPKAQAFVGEEETESCSFYQKGKAKVLQRGSGIAVLAVGSCVRELPKILEILKKEGVEASSVNLRFVKPLDTELIKELSETHTLLAVLEENVSAGGVGEAVAAFAASSCPKTGTILLGVGDRFIPQGTIAEQRVMEKMDAESAARRILDRYRRSKEKENG